MKKIKVGRTSIVKIAKEKYKLLGELPKERMSYDKWIEFIENHGDYFVWYENTEDGKNSLLNIDKVPDWAKDRVIHKLNKTSAYSTNKIVKKSFDLVVSYSASDGMITISLEEKMSKAVAEILLEMAKYLNGKLLIDGTNELECIDQLQ